MDQLRALRVFSRVIDEGGFAAAARAMDLAPAVVTRTVAELEEHLGARLIHRTTRRLALTDVGTQYLERARQILADVDDADTSAASASGELRGVIRVASALPFVTAQLVPRLSEFCERYPKLDLDFAIGPPLEQPDEGADLTFIMQSFRRPLAGDFVARLLAHSEVMMCATPAYLARRGRPQVPADLGDHDLLVPHVPFAPREWTFRNGVTGQDITVAASTARINSQSPDLLRSAALGDLGITGTLSFMVADALRDGTVERVLPDWSVGTYSVHVALPTRKHMPMRTRAFLDFLVEKFGGEPTDPWLPQVSRRQAGPPLGGSAL
jgi:DNA-binding transcriptional LysR family regulator